MRGQGATEYLVLLAVVLVIALVSIALLGFFPGLSTDTKITQSQSYWRSVRPFAINNYVITAAGNATFELQNNEAANSLTITSIVAGNSTTSALSLSFAPGEMRVVSVNAPSGTRGLVYDIPINISYNTSNSLSSTQYGAKTLTGKFT